MVINHLNQRKSIPIESQKVKEEEMIGNTKRGIITKIDQKKDITMTNQKGMMMMIKKTRDKIEATEEEEEVEETLLEEQEAKTSEVTEVDSEIVVIKMIPMLDPQLEEEEETWT